MKNSYFKNESLISTIDLLGIIEDSDDETSGSCERLLNQGTVYKPENVTAGASVTFDFKLLSIINDSVIYEINDVL